MESRGSFGRQVSGRSFVEPPPTRDPGGWWSPLERARAQDTPELPEVLTSPGLRLEEEVGGDPVATVPQEVASFFTAISAIKPLNIVAQGEVPCSGPLSIGVVSVSNSVAAAGTHNVILGLRRFLDRPELLGSQLWGIRSLSNGHEFKIDSATHGHFLNQGGSDLLPTIPLSRVSSRILLQVANLSTRLDLNGIIFLCGPSEMSEVAKISEYFGKEKVQTCVVAVVHSISGWVRLPGWVQTNLGFDSACRVLAEITGNTALSKLSLNTDNYHFLCCGSAPLTIEVALQIRPTLCYIGADVAERKLTLQAICDEICDVIVARHHDYGLHSGVVVVSDDFFESLVEMHELREELYRLRREKPAEMLQTEQARQLLPPRLGNFFEMLPADVCHCLVFQTGMDGLPLLKPQEAERELGALVARCLARRVQCGKLAVDRFAHHPRSARNLAVSPMPAPFDCALGYVLGHAAGCVAQHARNGYTVSIRNVGSAVKQWRPCAVPLVWLLRPGSNGDPPTVSRRQLTDDALFKFWHGMRDKWRYRLSYRQPGPVQFWGPGADPAAWTTYTLLAACNKSEEFSHELHEDSTPDQVFIVPLSPPIRLTRRQESLLSPLQRWRCTYKPKLPQVLLSHFHISEDDGRARVCADQQLVSTAFVSLAQTDNLKAVKIEQVQDGVSVLQMLPERPRRAPNKDSGGSWSPVSPVSQEQKTALSRSSQDRSEASDLDTRGLDFTFELKQVNMRIGIAIVGRAGPGLNNVIQGLFDYVQIVGGTVVCITMGIAGLINGHAFELTEKMLWPWRNQGGCDLLGQSQPEDLHKYADNLGPCAATARKLELDGLVIWGGKNVHCWTAHLAEYFAEHHVPTRVIAVPASVESDLPLIEQTLGHDTVCKLFASIVGNLATQAASSRMQWCFVRIPGRSISHMAAEVALETLPHVVLLSSQLSKEELGLPEVTQRICNVIEARSREGMNYGVVLIPDQFLATVREMKDLIEAVQEIRTARPDALQGMAAGVTRDFGPVLGLLPPLSRALLSSFPERVRAQILCVTDEGHRQGSLRSLDLEGVETELIVQALVETELTRRVVLGTYKGPFQCRTYSLPDHGRAAMPTNFDCDLGYTVGYAAGILVDGQRTGLLVTVTKLKEDVRLWEVGGTPLSSLMTFQELKKAGGRPTFEIEARARLTYDLGSEQGIPEPCRRTLVSRGPSQFEGPCASLTTQTLSMPQVQRVRQMARTDQLITELKAQASAGCPPEVLQAVRMLLQGGVNLIRQL